MRAPALLALLFSTLPLAVTCLANEGPAVYPVPQEGVMATIADDPASAAELGTRLAPMKSMRARFDQAVISADGYVLQEVSGTLAVARPGKVRWHSEEPFEQLVVSDAETLWLYDPDLEQVTVRPFSNDISRTPAVLFIGETQSLEQDYRVAAERDASRVRYLLQPRSDEALYERIVLEFEGGTPTGMALWDSLGQMTRIGFTEVEVNAELDAVEFSFTPPPGVDILVDE